MNINDFSTLVFRLTNSAIELAPDAHQFSQIQIIRDAIPFDAAWWGWSNFSGGRNRLINTGLFSLPQSFESAIRAVLHLDPLVKTGRNLAIYGKTIDVAAADLPKDYRACLDAFGIKSILNGHCRLQGETEFNFFLSLYKRDAGDTFSESHSDAFRLILHHIEQSLSLSLRAELRSLAPSGGEAAIVSEGGAIVRATGGFGGRLKADLVNPSDAARILADLSFGDVQWTGEKVMLESRSYGPGLSLVRIATNDVLAPLSKQERRVADALTMGKTMRQISDDRGVSHNTVRNQVAAIYKKMGVTSRVELLSKIGFSRK